MDIQEIIIFVCLVFAVYFLLRKFIFPKKKSKGCDTDCGCS
ncbi:MAG: FeoB-associated Cys-rich membrane protein [Flavobacterium sp.]